jgi:hypothetical protein
VQAATPEEFKHVIVTRTKLADVYSAPWFKEWVKGALFYLSFSSFRWN